MDLELLRGRNLWRMQRVLSEFRMKFWTVGNFENKPAQAYLIRQVKTFVPFDYFIINPEAQSIDKLNEEFVNNIKDPFEAQNTQEMPLITEHHVLWSMSYSVPVLYFNAWISDFPGINAVTVEQAQQLVPQGTLKYNELSQAIHPILGTIFLHLHPCMSKELLQNTSTSNNKLVSWLSTVAPAALNLKVGNEYFELTRTNKSVISKEVDEEKLININI
ncbi:ubiquitin-like-conjugating enzyme ATG10 isoform X2 [Chelonus insularis]|uniref:ubiquitin-like-conjugating enzyme ATG10 isoform X2 n=1 Tax=Chelonus insularis TaxID=460826 RepID=UPI00158CDBD4|nr:ubiquitin-like-conjugating enzyme ATG10 isoform X2 [Chelonus insularis]